MYYDVLVDSRNQADLLFTYQSDQELAAWQLVIVPFRGKSRRGLVVTQTKKPRFKCLEITQKLDWQLPKPLVKAGQKLRLEAGLTQADLAQLLLGSVPLKLANLDLPDGQIKPQPALTLAQKKVLLRIESAKARPQLLYGVTGSGKTRIYQELIEKTLAQGRSCLILVPEIGLSQQVYNNLSAKRLYHWHSSLGLKQRRAIWQSVYEQPAVVVGPRSSAWLPLKDLGLIVLDEAHDSAYQQQNQPFYRCEQFAHYLAAAWGAICLSGSATPNVTDYYRFRAAGLPICHLDQVAKPATKPQVIVVNRQNLASHQFLTKVADEKIKEALKSGGQALLYYNRRGSWCLVLCDQCHWRVVCQKCDQQLVCHYDKQALVCHHCNQSAPLISVCPHCQAPITYRYPGIKALTNYLNQNYWPDQVIRFDSDNVKRQSLAAKLPELSTTKKAILVGTQVISKGLDLPHLKTVIVIDAEQSFVGPDYRTLERYFQQIRQLVGRVGRGHQEKTSVVIQTRQPQDPTLNQAVASDWLGFYEAELERRREANLPPFSYIANIYIKRSSLASVKRAANKLLDELVNWPQIEFLGPAPALKRGRNQWLIHAICPQLKPLVDLKKSLSKEIVELEPTELFSGYEN